MEKLTHRLPTAPDHDFLCTLLNSIMKAAQQSRDDVTVIRVIIVMRAIQIGRHHTSVITTVLTVVTLTQFDTGNLGNGIRFVCWFQSACEQRLLGHWLLSVLGVNARRSEEQ